MSCATAQDGAGKLGRSSLLFSEISCQIFGGRGCSGEGAFPGSVLFSLLIFIPPLLHTHLSEPFEARGTPEEAVFKSGFSSQSEEVSFVSSEKYMKSWTS